MKKFKVFVGMCGPTPIVSNIIKANDKREALVKYYESIGEDYDEKKIENELKNVFEHPPNRAKKRMIMI